MKNFAFTVSEGTDKTLFIDLSMPEGTVTGRLYITTANAGEQLVAGGVTGVASNGVTIYVPTTYTTSAQFPATFRLDLSNNGGTTWTTYATGRGTLATNPITDSTAEIVLGTDSAGTNRPILVDSAGRLSTVPNSSLTSSTGSLTTVDNTHSVTVSGSSVFTFYFSGTFAGANIAFEQSPDGVNWYATNAANTATYTLGNSTGAFSAASAWELAAPGASQVRARLTAITSGTVDVATYASPLALEPTPVVGTHPVTQSGTWAVTSTPATPTAYSLTTAATTNADNIKNTAGTLYELTVSNPTATPVYVKFYSKTTAPTVGTDTPILTVPVPATSVQALNFGSVGKRVNTGISIAVTANPLATDTTAAVAGVQVHASYL